MIPGDLITIVKYHDKSVTGSWVTLYREPSTEAGGIAMIESTAVGLLIHFDEKSMWGLCLFSGLRFGWLNITWIVHA